MLTGESDSIHSMFPKILLEKVEKLNNFRFVKQHFKENQQKHMKKSFVLGWECSGGC